MIQKFLRHISLELNRSRQTVRAYEADLRGFNEYILKSGVPAGDSGFFVASAVNTADIREYVASLSEGGASPVTIRRKIQALRAYFRFLVKSGATEANPASAVPLPKTARKLPVITTHDDVARCIEETRTLQEALILSMLYGCGLRRSELLAINDPDINPFSKELKILGKGNKHRVIPLPDSLLREIEEWQKRRDELYPDLPLPRPLFVTKFGRMSQTKLYEIVHSALGDTHAQQKSPHTLRHSFATQLLNSGADINSVKELLGHSSLGATQIYTHVAFSELNREWSKAHPRAGADKK